MNSKYQREEPPKLTNDDFPPKTFYRLGEAADILGCSKRTLIHYGATARLQLLAGIPENAVVFPKNFVSGEVDDSRFDTPNFFVLPTSSCLQIDMHGRTTVRTCSSCYEIYGRFEVPIYPYSQTDPDDENQIKENRRWYFVLSSSADFLGDDSAVQGISVKRSDLRIFAKEIQRFKSCPENGIDQELDISAEKNRNRESRSNQNRSDKLALLNQVFFKYWSNADPGDPQTHPKNAVVVSWLIEHGRYSRALAEKAATIIRPEWAKIGRPQEK